jgi:sec-independent protein translocase protein TatA
MSTLAVTMPGGAEWIIILVVFILLFGAKKLPELGSSVGKSIKNFKRGLGEGDAAEDETPSSPTATRDQQ